MAGSKDVECASVAPFEHISFPHMGTLKTVFMPSTIYACGTTIADGFRAAGHSMSNMRYLALLLPIYMRRSPLVDDGIKPWNISVF